MTQIIGINTREARCDDGGSLEQTGWVSPQDGLLVMDRNGNGKIDNISETFSEYFNGITGSGGNACTKPYTDGFAALKSQDSNSDNVFNSSDTAFNNVRVWLDANHDGKTDAGELKTLNELGISQINLAAKKESGAVRDGTKSRERQLHQTQPSPGGGRPERITTGMDVYMNSNRHPVTNRFCVALAIVVSLLAPAHAAGAVGDKGTMDDACSSTDARVNRLCQIVSEKFKEPQDSYVHLGDDFFVVLASKTSRVAQGIYVANVKTGQLNLLGGYGLPELGSVIRETDGSVWIGVKQSSMSRGRYWEVESFLERRLNPITKTPFLVSHETRAMAGLSEEMQSFCSRPENSQASDCSGLGETIRLNQEEIERIRDRSSPVDVKRILAAHKDALRVHKSKKFRSKNPFQLLEEAGIWHIIDMKPPTMSIDQYVNVLNDYAFFAYQYSGGRNDLAIEILDKVIKLSPWRAPAYLNMAEALEYLAEYGATEYATVPLDDATIDELRAAATIYRGKHLTLSKKTHSNN